MIVPPGIPFPALAVDDAGQVCDVNDLAAARGLATDTRVLEVLGLEPSRNTPASDTLGPDGVNRVSSAGHVTDETANDNPAGWPGRVAQAPPALGARVGPDLGGWRLVLLEADGNRTDVLGHGSYLAEELDLAIVVTDATNRVHYASPVFSALLGTGEPLEGRPLDVTLRLRRNGIELPLQVLRDQARKEGSGLEIRTGLTMGRGETWHPVQLRIVALERGRMPLGGWLLQLVDRSVDRKLEGVDSQVQHAREISRAATGIAHELNNSATTLMTALQRLLAQSDSHGATGSTAIPHIPRDTEQTEAREAQAAVRRVRRLGLQLERFAGVDAYADSDDRANQEELSAVLLEETVLDAVSLALGGSTVRLSFSIDEDVPSVRFPSHAISQATFNVVANAVEAMDEDGVLNVGIRPNDEQTQVVVEVRDDGHGMDPRILDRITEPYFSTKPGGVGMGLAVSLSLMQGAMGSLEITSEPGFGSTVRLVLPVAPAATSGNGPRSRAFPGVVPTQRAVQAGSEPGGSGLPAVRVLVAEDDPLVRRSIVRALERLGMDVNAVSDGDRAVEAFLDGARAGTGFGLLMTDFSMPGRTDGVQLLRRLREIEPELPAILSSGALHLHSAARYREAGFQYVLRKPFGEPELHHALRVALSNA